MLDQFLRHGLVAILCTGWFVGAAAGQSESCDVCGDEVHCKKVCCLKCEMREVRVNCWKSEFEDICVPCPSTKCGQRCIAACNCKEGSDSCGRKLIFGIWQASGAEIKTRRKLLRKTETKLVPVFSWQVQTRCHRCCENCVHATHTLPGGVPALPEGVELIDVSQECAQQNRIKKDVVTVPTVAAQRPGVQQAPVTVTTTQTAVEKNTVKKSPVANIEPDAVRPPIRSWPVSSANVSQRSIESATQNTSLIKSAQRMGSNSVIRAAISPQQ